jgi:hypothetical protein
MASVGFSMLAALSVLNSPVVDKRPTFLSGFIEEKPIAWRPASDATRVR